MIFEKHVTELKKCFDFLQDLHLNVSRFKKNLARYDQKCIFLPHFSWNSDFFRRIFVKSSDIKFYENPSSGSQVVPCGQMDRHENANSRSLQIYEHA